LLEAPVRIARRDDVPALVALMTEFYGEAGYPLSPEPATRAFRALLDDPRLGRVWLVEDGARPVGYLVLTLGFSMEFGGLRGFIDDFFVLPTARGRGLGAAALAAVKSECIALGVRALLVETGPAGHPARKLYARAGFQESGRVLLSQALASALHEPPEPE
jgi:GNAT superfamily N-acetyltransferase